MAKKRMVSNDIIDSDAFQDMPTTAQLLYFRMILKADDDGFVANPRTIMRLCRSSDDDLRILGTKKFVIPFDTGIVVIKHWRIHNYIAKDRYTETNYKKEKATLYLDENKSYTLNPDLPAEIKSVDNLYTTCIQPVDNLYTKSIQPVDADKNRLDKNRLDKNRLDKNRLDKVSQTSQKKEAEAKREQKRLERLQLPTRGEFDNVHISDEEYGKAVKRYGEKAVESVLEDLSGFIETDKRADNYTNHYRALLKWLKRDYQELSEIEEQKQKANEPDWDESDMQPEVDLGVPDDLDMDNLPF